ncbi:serine hydrolase domain-containing protein [Aliidiomarina celeris]|uniref:serine hydrolase domain-containing protein n=1 Tax=Aliidiomarina celeris TaxID=2249428 RepID=UPI001300657C|nr:serine hydrolase domain-containing protein [Aliidiomarina celeris]
MVDHQSSIGLNIDRYLSALEALGFSGAIIVDHGGEVVLRKGYGLADRESRRPYTPTTVQSHGSITKQMTGAAILLLESRGKLSVDDSLDLYFDDLPEGWEAISLHQLLTHSSGLSEGVGPDEESIAAQAYLDRLMAEPLQFAPGSGYAYSNAGYSLLGMIVERVSGQSYEAFLRNELLLPAGMSETGYLLPAWDRDRLAAGYRNGERWGLVQGRGWLDDGPNWNLRANGGLHTTVDDMHRWLNTVRGRGVLDVEAALRWTTGYIDEWSDNSKYAYGWVVSDTKWGRMISHQGSNGIFSAEFVWLPEKELFFYIQGNSLMVSASVISALEQRERLLAAAFDAEFPLPPLVEAASAASPEEAGQREGIYHLEGGTLELTADDTRLFAKLSGQSVLNSMLNPTEAQRTQFAELNQRTKDAMDRLEVGQKDAIAGMLAEGEDPVERTRPLLNRISQISSQNGGELRSLHVIGSFKNAPGSRFADLGPWTTFVYAEFEHWNQYWNLVWNSDGTYRGNWSGPWPSFILVPTAKAEYRGVRQGPAWETVGLHFDDDCLVVGGLRACRVE